MHVFGLQEEAGLSEENPHRHGGEHANSLLNKSILIYYIKIISIPQCSLMSLKRLGDFVSVT